MRQLIVCQPNKTLHGVPSYLVPRYKSVQCQLLPPSWAPIWIYCKRLYSNVGSSCKVIGGKASSIFICHDFFFGMLDAIPLNMVCNSNNNRRRSLYNKTNFLFKFTSHFSSRKVGLLKSLWTTSERRMISFISDTFRFFQTQYGSRINLNKH